MYLIEVSYKTSKYYRSRKPEYELLSIQTLCKDSEKNIKKLKKVLDKLYFDNNNTNLCLAINDKDELSLLLIDNFITHYAGDCYDSKDGFRGELISCVGASNYLQSISNHLALFNIEHVVDSSTYLLNDKPLQDIHNESIVDDLEEDYDDE